MLRRTGATPGSNPACTDDSRKADWRLPQETQKSRAMTEPVQAAPVRSDLNAPAGENARARGIQCNRPLSAVATVRRPNAKCGRDRLRVRFDDRPLPHRLSIGTGLRTPRNSSLPKTRSRRVPLPDPFYPELIKYRIGRHELQVFEQTLGRQHSVKRVTMGLRKTAG